GCPRRHQMRRSEIVRRAITRPRRRGKGATGGATTVEPAQDRRPTRRAGLHSQGAAVCSDVGARDAARYGFIPFSGLIPSGRPVGSISEFRRRFEPHMGDVAETLLALMRSPNENTRLQAVREILDRTLGRSSIAIDATHTKIDIGQLYLRACEPR